ncbi:MAG: signal peptide peptidase SppA [Paludibacteraceae bacterium]|nr:signal peptide peptidase SppA [Paludibacteraceae bacterium]
MKDFIKYMLATVCGIILLSTLSTIMFFMSFVSMALSSDSGTKLSKHSVYRINLEGELVEQTSEDDLTRLIAKASKRDVPEQIGLNDLLRNIRYAKEDKHIDGILLQGGSLAAGFASREEIRRALLDFKESGKFIVAYADSYSQGNYWLASVADKVCLNSRGALSWAGLSSNIMFYSRALEKLGVEMQVVKVGTFKSAVEPYMLTGMSEPNRLQMSVMLEDMWSVVTSDVSASRGLTMEELNRLADKNMVFAEQSELVSCGLIDTLMYQQDIKPMLERLTGTENYKIVSHNAMLGLPDRDKSRKDKVAVIYAEGEITDDSGEGIVGKDMVKLINKIAKEDEVKAVVLRVNSPGGSAYASEQIWHALSLLKEKKPLVVSMGDYAASGGYYISCVADSIFAEPTTLTGSIGIFGLIPNVAGLADKVGIDFDGVGTNRLSLTESNMIYKGMNTEERALMQGEINRGYELFTGRCADGRRMPKEKIKEIAEGRVWSGKRAMQIGLVDRMGNLADAVSAAAGLADLDKYEVVDADDSKDGFLDALLEMYGLDDGEQELLREYRRIRRMAEKPSVQARLPYEIEIR